MAESAQHAVAHCVIPTTDQVMGANFRYTFAWILPATSWTHIFKCERGLNKLE